ncbi:MAG: type II secretion system protein [Spirochaetota bacterium]
MIKFLKTNNKGFTLIELIVVIAVFSILSIVVMPRIINYLSSARDNFLIFSTIVAKTFDDAFINHRTNFFVIHCHSKENEISEISNTLFERTNGISVAILNDNSEFIDNPNKLLKTREFPDSFAIKEVLLPDGSIYTSGNVMIPVYSSGSTSGAIVHILTNNEEEWSLIINPYIKAPKVVKGYTTYEDIK